MKLHKIIFSAICISVLLLCGCRDDNMGYPKSIKVVAEGDSIFLPKKVDYWCIGTEGNFVVATPETIETPEGKISVTEYQWLRVEQRASEDKILVIAAPNSTGAPRTLYVNHAIFLGMESTIVSIALNQQ